ncbi:arylsulfatase B-like [Strongylocentrotus purpuratus]|uniref:Sulfatase N-terminal domain-containing protein n=1 Tax=Strongylocentrotus purpuratus TaxID=7668 RepID=A0A7M7N4C8_STRPU|nr:arylsulfatase B-like [Strongylocentrotus purpuratus]
MVKIHTGMQHSIIWVAQPLCHPLSDPTMADKLRKAGYATHAVGKWHMGYYKKGCWPTNRGFDSFFGLLTGRGGFYTHKHYGGHPGLVDSKNWSGYDLRDNLEQVAQDYQGVYSTHLFTQKSQNIIRRHNRSKVSEQNMFRCLKLWSAFVMGKFPLFLYHSFQAVHYPLEVPPRYMEDFNYIADERRRTYAGMVKCMDEAVGNLTRTLKKTGLWNNTIIIFSSDNGANFNYGGSNWPLRGMKRSLWEGGIKSVGFIASPLLPKLVRGTVNNNLFHVTDWFPTLVRGVARGSLKGTHLDGHNLWKHLLNKKKTRGKDSWPRKEILHNIDPYSPIFSELPRWFSINFPAAIRYENWKLITSQIGNRSWVPPPESGENTIHSTDTPEKRVWLFDISEDPKEMNDLSLERTDITYFLLRRLGSYLRGSVPIRYPGPDIRANPSLHNGSFSDWIL